MTRTGVTTAKARGAHGLGAGEGLGVVFTREALLLFPRLEKSDLMDEFCPENVSAAKQVNSSSRR